MCFVLNTVTHRRSRWTHVSFISFVSWVSHDANFPPRAFWPRLTCRTLFSCLPSWSLKWHAVKWRWSKPSRYTGATPFTQLYLSTFYGGFFSFQRLDFVVEQATTWYKSFSHSRSWPVWNINPSYCRIILVWFFQHALLPSLHQVLEGQVDPLHPVQTCDPCFRFRTATCVGNAAKTSLKNVSTRIHTIRNSSF